MTVTYPYGYGTGTKTMSELRARYEPKMHPEFARRFFAWLESQGGQIGIGGGWRKTPSDTSAASRAGKSFHQDQRFASGFVGYSAVDCVAKNPGKIHRAPTQQEAETGLPFGLHANVGTPGTSGYESWHIQCIPQDGFDSWVNAGRPDPDPNFVLPGVPVFPEKEDDMHVTAPDRVLDTRPGNNAYKLGAGKAAEVTIPGAAGYRTAQVTVTVTEPEAPGFLSTWATGPQPETSFLNFEPGDVVTETLLVVLDGAGKFQVYSSARTHLIVDFTGILFG